MTTGKHGAPTDPDDGGDALLVLDDAARVESDWLLARDRDRDAPAPSAEIASDYAEIEDLLRELPLGPSDESWHAEVLRAAVATMSPPRPWWRRTAFRWTMMGAGVVAAAAVVLLVVVPPTRAELEVALQHVDTTRGGPNEAVVGDHLVVTARPHGPAELRVYRSDGTLVARCPDGPGCRTLDHGELAIEIRLDAPVPYQVILVVGVTALPDGTMNAYLDAANAAHADIVTYPLIEVR
jgi:hypothetical protein